MYEKGLAGAYPGQGPTKTMILRPEVTGMAGFPPADQPFQQLLQAFLAQQGAAPRPAPRPAPPQPQGPGPSMAPTRPQMGALPSMTGRMRPGGMAGGVGGA